MARDSKGRFVSGSGVKVKDVDHGYKKRVEALLKANGPANVKVGVFAGEGAKPKEDSKISPPRDTSKARPLTLIEVAIWNEFGFGNIPERSYLRAYVDINKSRIEEMIKRLMQAVADDKLPYDHALEQLGLKIVGEIQERITQGIPPPNAEATVEAKGSSTPLIDTGQLRASITYKVDRTH